MIGYDTASSSFSTPTDAQFIVCYGDRLYENERAAHARFPKLVKAGRAIDLTAGSAIWKDPFSGSDIEPGNAGPSTAAPYIKGEHANGVKRPVVYADLSDMRTVADLVQQAGIVVGAAGTSRPWRMYTAHPTGTEHLCGPKTCGFPWDADITQWFWSSLQGHYHGFGGDLDVNVARDDAFPDPASLDPYAIFPSNLDRSLPNHGNERLTVEQADGALEHPVKFHDYLKDALYGELKAFRDRIWRVSHYQPPSFTRSRQRADWGDERGARWQLLNQRMEKIAVLK